MYKSTITIIPDSFLLTASGEGQANVDAQIVYDALGFPMFPGKRLKGLLREAMIEVLEIEGKNETEINDTIIQFFGKSGAKSNEGILDVPNLFPEGYEAIKPKIATASSKQMKSEIKDYFNFEIQQTALDEHEIAKDKSLRNYHVLNFKRGFSFNGDVLFKEALNQTEKDLWEKTLSQFRYAGSRRNRGFGKIKCESTDLTKITNTEDAALILTEGQLLKIQIKTLQPVILSTKKGDENTVYSEDIVTGNRLRGALASLYLKKKTADAGFKEIFLRNKIQFNPCTKMGASPVPANIHLEKYTEVKTPINVFQSTEKVSTRKLNGIYTNATQEVEVTKKHQFHNSRPHRSAGRSEESQDEGGIFYYESIDADQAFEGSLTGDVDAINKLLAIINSNSTEIQLGRSRSAQYGKARIDFEAVDPSGPKSNTQATYMVAETPIILFNENGFPSPNLETLKSYLDKSIEIDDEKAAVRLTSVEQYNSQWQSKSGKIRAIAEGSVFKIKKSDSPTSQIGEWTDQGFGGVKFYTESEMAETKEKIKLTTYQLSEKKDSITEITDDNELFIAMKNAVVAKNKVTETKTEAIQDAIKFTSAGKVSNSLIGRMIGLISGTTSKVEMKDILNQLNNGDKPAGNTLNRTGLYGRLLNFDRPSFADGSYKTYWLTFFTTLRNRKKMKSND